ncbi:MAG: hypothetical protein JSS00_07860, partial [Proteobacteria bacterium]|nr:hypothetical protein [Pseudomonadota bacterium]
RVFVRDGSGPYVRIDGYGVAGYAYVDSAFIGNQPPATAPGADNAAHPAAAPSTPH